MRLSTWIFAFLITTSSFSQDEINLAVKNGQVYFTDHSENGTVWRVDEQGSVARVINNFNGWMLPCNKGKNIFLLDPLSGKKGEYRLITLNQNNNLDSSSSQQIRINHFAGVASMGNNGSLYYVADNQIFRYQEGKHELLLKHKFEDVTALYVDRKDNLWIADNGVNHGTLYRYKGQLVRLADQLLVDDPDYALYKDKNKHYISSVTMGPKGYLYVSENTGCRVLKLNGLGEKTVFYQSPTLWSPDAIRFDESNAYILETGYNKKLKGPRLLKKNSDGQISRVVNIETLPPEKVTELAKEEKFSIPNWVYFAIGSILFGALIIWSVKKQFTSE